MAVLFRVWMACPGTQSTFCSVQSSVFEVKTCVLPEKDQSFIGLRDSFKYTIRIKAQFTFMLLLLVFALDLLSSGHIRLPLDLS